MFAYLESLVSWGVVCEVFASFLPIGHTHSDINQTFSCTAGCLHLNDAAAIDGMMSQLRLSFTPEPHVAHIKGLVCFPGLCEKTNTLQKVKHFSVYCYFHFMWSQNSSDVSETYYCTMCMVRVGCNDYWEPLNIGKVSGFFKESA